MKPARRELDLEANLRANRDEAKRLMATRFREWPPEAKSAALEVIADPPGLARLRAQSGSKKGWLVAQILDPEVKNNDLIVRVA